MSDERPAEWRALRCAAQDLRIGVAARRDSDAGTIASDMHWQLKATWESRPEEFVMRLKTLSCLAVLALAPIAAQSPAAASPLAQAAAAKAAVPAGIQLAQVDKLRGGGRGGGGDGVYTGGRGGGRGGGGDGVYTGGRSGGRSGGGDGVYTGGRGGDGVYTGGRGGRSRGGDGVYTGGRGGDGVYTGGRGNFRDRSAFRDRGFRDRSSFRSFDGDRRFVDRRIDRRHAWRGDRWRHRRVFRDGIWVYPYTSYAYSGRCHRHFRGARVLRHCHLYSYRWHHHGRWS
jgi:hypothetical protein